MNEYVLSAMILVAIAWIIFRVGKRQSRRAMRALASTRAGVYRPGGIFGQSLVELPYGGARVRVSIKSLSWFGGRFLATFNAPWSSPRPALVPSSPAALEIPVALDHHSPATRPVSAELRATVERFLSFAAASDHQIHTQRDQYYARSTLSTVSTPQMVYWFEMNLRIYNLLAAETEAGIEFATGVARPSAEGCCQVCGAPPEPADTVYCQSCGAPHHAECWEYNRGCAIYGCRCQP